MAFFRFKSRKCTGGVNERNHRHIKLIGQPHETQGFTVALRISTAEITFQIALGITTFLRADDHDLLAVYFCKSADDGTVITMNAVAMNFDKVGGHIPDIIQRIRPLRMAGNLNFLPCCQVAVDLPAGRRDLFFHPFDFVRDIDILLLAEVFQFVQFFLKLKYRFFKRQCKRRHNYSVFIR